MTAKRDTITDIPAGTPFDIHGERITPRRLRRGMRTSTGASMFGMLWVAVALGVPTTMFMEALGASGVLIGAVVTVQQLAMAVQIPGALFAERLKTRKKFWAFASCAHRLVWMLPPLLPMVFRSAPNRAAVWMLIVVGVSSVLGQSVTASWMSWMADLVPDGMKGRFWGRRQTATMMAYLAGTIFVGWLLDCFPDPGSPNGSFLGFTIAFAFAAVMGTVDVLVHALVPEPRPVERTGSASVAGRLAAPLRDADFRWLTLAMGSWTFSVGLVGSFGMIYLKRDFHASYLELTSLAVAASIGTAVSGPLWGRMMDRVGPRAFGGITLALAPLCGFAWFLVDKGGIAMPWLGGGIVVPQPVFILFFSSLIAGALYSGVALCQMNLAGMLAPRQGRTVAMAMHWTVVGVTGAMGPILGGQLMDLLIAHPLKLVLPGGAPVSFIHVLVLCHLAVVWLVCLPVFARIKKRSGGEVSLRALAGNPLRALGMLQNMMAMDAADPQARVRAVQGLGAGRVVEATATLVSYLDDAMPEVRAAAADALGRIGTPEAVEALLTRLRDPESGLEEVIIRALRGTRDPRMVEPLLGVLRAGDRTAKAESARTLGEAGQRQVAPELLAMLRDETDPKLAFAYAEALVLLREDAVLPELLKLKNRAETTARQRAVALLLAEMLGHQGRFYELILTEEKEPGSSVPVALARLRRAGRRLPKNHPEVAELTLEAEAAYDDARYRMFVAKLLRLGELLIPGFGPDAADNACANSEPASQMPVANWRWFMEVCLAAKAGNGGEPDLLDALLALHFLSEWQSAKGRP